MQIEIQELVSLNFMFRDIMERIFLTPQSASPFNELTGAQLKALHFLDMRGALKMSELARLVSVTMPAATALVEKLVRAEMAEREYDSHDRRIVRVALTPKGSKTIEELRRMHEKRLEQFLEKLEPKKRQELIAAFARIHELLSEIDVTPSGDMETHP